MRIVMILICHRHFLAVEKVFEASLPDGELDAVIAICNNWPESVTNTNINHWLKENDGYWWAEKLLAGESI
jgi:hypothetical protein